MFFFFYFQKGEKGYFIRSLYRGKCFINNTTRSELQKIKLQMHNFLFSNVIFVHSKSDPRSIMRYITHIVDTNEVVGRLRSLKKLKYTNSQCIT